MNCRHWCGVGSKLGGMSMVELGDQKSHAIKLCAQLVQAKDVNLSSAASDVLSRFDDAVPLLVEALQSKNLHTQANAARALSSIASRQKLPWDQLDVASPHLAKLLQG